MKHRIIKLSLILVSILLNLNSTAQETLDWTHFRGSELAAVANGEFALHWSDSTGLTWMTPIEGRGWSSPVVLDNQVWLTSASPDGQEMFAVCVDYTTGEIIHHIDLFQPDTIFRKHAVNSYATPTAAIENGRVYVHFGRYGTACIDTETGKEVWRRTDMLCKHVQGPGASLFLHQDKLIVHMEGTDVQDIYALDKFTGETIWKAFRDKSLLDKLDDIGKKAYVTPVIVTVDGRELLISNGSAACNAYDVNTGEEVWVIPQGEDSTISMPVAYKGKVYFYTGFVTPEEGEKYCELWAVDPRGTSDLTGNIIWRRASPILQLLTPVIYNDLLYTVDTKSIFSCVDVATGETVWETRLKGKFNASPIAANGLIYVFSTRGDAYVVKAGKEFKLLAENKLDGEIWATPAFVNGSILVRTSKGLYRID